MFFYSLTAVFLAPMLFVLGALRSILPGFHKTTARNDAPLVTEEEEHLNETLRIRPSSSSEAETTLDLDPTFRLPYYTDSEPEEEIAEVMTSSGYASSSAGGCCQSDIDWDYEIYKISVAPRGPVPDERVLMTVTCLLTGLYVKAVRFDDEEDQEEMSRVTIVTYAPTTNGGYEWRDTECEECLRAIRESLEISEMVLECPEEKEEEEEEEDVTSSEVDDADDEDDDEERIEHCIGPLFSLDHFVLHPLPRGTEEELLSESDYGYKTRFEQDQELGSQEPSEVDEEEQQELEQLDIELLDDWQYDLAEVHGADDITCLAFA